MTGDMFKNNYSTNWQFIIFITTMIWFEGQTKYTNDVEQNFETIMRSEFTW